ncbi:class I SAM-dependent methyltransferase [Halostella salina]|uniref:class I SAM-dependent methyltransferase n=1 Tax=Halostella salina TaxID=1547897 RepID=UPI000EF80932|nr:class I SAM-dependent methyltransferase [Halostella salina]
MDPSTTDPTVLGYDELSERTDADGWESPWGDNPLQEHYSWPATRALLPNLDGQRVLDAGCGVGDHVEELLDDGATVVGIDVSEPAVETARDRFDDRASFERADLAEPLPFGDDAFDVVCSHLVLDHIENLTDPFSEFRRVLTADGSLVFTVVHPMQYYLDYDAVAEYYGTTAVTLGWEGVDITSYQRPVGEILTALVDAGFRIDAVEEPRPTAAYEAHAADDWNVNERPQILCVRARSGDQ